jgi:hypothetical protein
VGTGRDGDALDAAQRRSVPDVGLDRGDDDAGLESNEVNAGERDPHPCLDHDALVEDTIEDIDRARGWRRPLRMHRERSQQVRCRQRATRRAAPRSETEVSRRLPAAPLERPTHLMPSRPSRRDKRYRMAVPVPSLDKRGRELIWSDVQRWVTLAQQELTECFGGATAVPAPGTNIVGGRVLYEAGQVLVVSACDSREAFLANRDRIEAFVIRMGEELNQDAVFVLAFDSDSFLIELEEGG